jgi:hypothetical protein
LEKWAGENIEKGRDGGRKEDKLKLGARRSESQHMKKPIGKPGEVWEWVVRDEGATN